MPKKHTVLCGHLENIDNNDSHIDLQCFFCLFVVILTLEFQGFLTLSAALEMMLSHCVKDFKNITLRTTDR